MRFRNCFRKSIESGADSVLCFCVSSEVSATYGAAVAARQTMPEREIHVVDTLNLTMGQGFMVLGAAEAARNGKPVPDQRQAYTHSA
jgi:fatty acid-binding protein DegV